VLVFTNSILNSTDNFPTPRPTVINCLLFDDILGFISNNGNILETEEATFARPQVTRLLGAQFGLKPDSAAFTAADDGGQVGIFGGDSPFIIGAFPPVPRITELKVRSASTVSGVTFQVKAEAQK